MQYLIIPDNTIPDTLCFHVRIKYYNNNSADSAEVNVLYPDVLSSSPRSKLSILEINGTCTVRRQGVGFQLILWYSGI
jgi:hypothetical protein